MKVRRNSDGQGMLTIREARLPEDKAAIFDFIVGLQRYEAGFESNRRLDATFAQEHFAELLPDSAQANRAVFIAEDRRPLGWAVVYEQHGEVYIRAEERHYGFIAELFVVDAARGKGVGRALIEACEEWTRQRRLTTIRIAHLSGNTRAAAIYAEAGYFPYALHVRKRL
jgi:GNAT superfamily N-acetyltransferase